MNEIKCPKCGTVFQVDERGYADIVRQVRDEEFKRQLAEREELMAHEREQAVELAARTGVLVLTGGPGTGKTTTVRGIVALFRRMGLEIVLAAPTGRAAKRMSELTGMEAQTVHRMLGMSWNDVT